MDTYAQTLDIDCTDPEPIREQLCEEAFRMFSLSSQSLAVAALTLQ